MIAREAAIFLNRNIQRVIDVDDIERMSGIQDLNNRPSNPRGLNRLFLNELSWLRIDRLPPYERRSRQRRRWKLSNCFRCTSAARDEDIPSLRNAPPTYSSIFTDSHEFALPENDQSFVVTRIPPPTYTQAQGIDLVDSFVSVPPNAASNWPRVPAAAICPRCSTFIITVVVVRRSTMTHITALTLFLLGCWPCCVIPYCMDSCSNTDHYCPICRAYLGTYTP